MGSKDELGIEVYMLFWTKDRKAGPGTPKRKQAIHWEMRKSKCVVNKLLPGHPEPVGHRKV